jgi:hypothetical protein
MYVLSTCLLVQAMYIGAGGKRISKFNYEGDGMKQLINFLIVILLIGTCRGLITESPTWISPDIVEIDGQRMTLEGVSCSGLSEGMNDFITTFWQCMTDNEIVEYEIVEENGNFPVITMKLDDINVNKKIMEEVLFYQ